MVSALLNPRQRLAQAHFGWYRKTSLAHNALFPGPCEHLSRPFRYCEGDQVRKLPVVNWERESKLYPFRRALWTRLDSKRTCCDLLRWQPIWLGRRGRFALTQVDTNRRDYSTGILLKCSDSSNPTSLSSTKRYSKNAWILTSEYQAKRLNLMTQCQFLPWR